MTVAAASRRVRPTSAPDLARALKEADESDLAVIPWGGGAQQYLGNPARRADLILETQALRGVVEYTTADLTVTVGAGTPLAELQAELARAGQRLPLDPPHEATATVGGLIATNASGPRRQRHGTLRDLLIGTRTALVDGTVVRSGGKVVKNVAGYDLNKLLIGSLGTLGIIVEATFKVLPLPERESAVSATFATLRAAIDAATSVARTPLRPTAVEAHERDGVAALVVVAEGTAAAVARTLDDVARIAREHRAREVVLHDAAEPLLVRTRSLLERAHDGAVLRASLPLSAQAAYAEELRRVARERSCGLEIAAHGGAGVVRAHLRGDPEGVRRAIVEGVALAAGLDGDAWVERLADSIRDAVPDVWFGEPPGLFLMRRIKAEFDPKSTLSPGRFVGGI